MFFESLKNRSYLVCFDWGGMMRTLHVPASELNSRTAQNESRAVRDINLRCLSNPVCACQIRERLTYRVRDDLYNRLIFSSSTIRPDYINRNNMLLIVKIKMIPRRSKFDDWQVILCRFL